MSVSTRPELSHDRPARPKWDRRRSRAALPVFGLAFVAMAGIGIVAAGMIPRRSQQAALAEASHEVRALVATPRVKVVSPIREAKPVSLRLPADLLPDLESPLHARAGGFLKQVLVKIGDRVEAGQLLAEIEAPEMDQELDRTRATVLQATADADLAVARRELASLNLKRAEALSRRGAATAQELDEHRAALQVATATVGSATATVTARKAEVRRLEERISFRRVVAPFSGTITARDVDPGALIVAEGSGQKPLFRIAQDETVKVVVSVPQAHLASVRNGQDVRILVREFPGRTFLGRVARTARAVDPASRTLRTEIDLANADRTLYTGMFVEVEFTRAVTAPLTVPANAVLAGPGGARVLVVGPAGRVRLQPIAIGRDLGGQIEVAGGLKGDERLVENPTSGFADGTRVEVVGNLAERAILPAKDKS